MNGMDKLRALVSHSKNLVFFGGAGVSTESGIPDFRSEDGLYSQQWKYPPETIISHSFFEENPAEFYRFYKGKMLWPDAKPNAAHLELARLEAAGKLSAIITQNIDGLHQAAGSKTVYELHGSVHRNYCMECGKRYDLCYMLESEGIPRCSCGGMVRPDVVLYEESLDGETINAAVRALECADLLIVGGTSLAVYPAAGLVNYCHGTLAVINQSPTPLDMKANLLIQDSIGTVFGALEE